MAKGNIDKKVLIILQAILMSKDYRDCYKKYIETKHKAHDKKDMSNHLAWYEIVRRWGFVEPLDPSVDVKKISSHALWLIILGWKISRGAVGVNWDVQLQLKGKARVQPKVELSVDLRYSLTKIKQEIEVVVKKLQALRRQEKIETECDECCLADFLVYEKHERYKKRNPKLTFYTMARRKLRREALSTEVDLEAKKMRNSCERVKWLIDGGYEILKKKI